MKLLDYCMQNNWAGYDPYDGLNSKVFQSLPFVQNRIGRLALTQAMKRSPVNFRPILRVPEAQNPKALALFSSALLILSKMGWFNNDDTIFQLLKKMVDLKSPERPHFCWGYHFDWQARDGFTPKFSPNIICTTFAGNALLDIYDTFADDRCIEMAVSAGQFLLNGLNITKGDGEICFSYTPLDWSQVHNANLLGAAYLARLYSITKERKFLEPAEKAVSFSTRRQNEDGAWPYGEDKTQQWVDNFHTGYNLVALKRFSEYTENRDVLENVRKGFQFYRANLFTEDGLPKYYHDRLYPIDIHAVAYSIITLVEFEALDRGNIDLANRIFAWAAREMQDEKGFFFYQKNRYFKNRIPYMRWSQAWMLLSLALLLKANG